mmetsp:Transcript_86857/g.274201  ORF Transcript_86857/g.274201 Transcript_86857/m.274201 type:complete len:234 (+) Transcript_86857:1789-2490(+)
MVLPRDRHVLQLAIGPPDLLPRLHGHDRPREQSAVAGDAEFGLADHEPLTASPFLPAALLFEQVHAAPHAEDRLGVLTHGNFLEVHVRLEHDLPNTRPLQPGWLELLRLQPALARSVVGARHRLEGEDGSPALHREGLHGQTKILQIHGSCRVVARGKAHGEGTGRALREHQAAQARRALEQPATHGGGGVVVRGHGVQAPAYAKLPAARSLRLGVLLPAGLLLLPRYAKEEL